MLTYQALLDARIESFEFRAAPREMLLYALAVGAGAGMPDKAALPFVYEADFRFLPTHFSTIAWAEPGWLKDIGIDVEGIVHLSEKVEMFAKPKLGSRLVVRPKIIGVFDKGAAKGSFLHVGFEIADTRDGRLLGKTTSILYCRRNGGISGAPEPTRPAERLVPKRPEDDRTTFRTRPDQAALYRLCGDMNPIHIDPAVAAKSGFSRPLLHGLCTSGIICLNVTLAVAGKDIGTFEVDFVSPVFPGEELVIKAWYEGATVSFLAQADDDRTVARGTAILTETATA